MPHSRIIIAFTFAISLLMATYLLTFSRRDDHLVLLARSARNQHDVKFMAIERNVSDPTERITTPPPMKTISGINRNFVYCNYSDLGLDSLPSFLSFLTNCTTLNLSHNRITELPDLAFEHLVYLEHLDLSDNHIQNLSEKSFKGLSSLKSLDLRANVLATRPENFPTRVFIPLQALESLVMSENNANPCDISLGYPDEALSLLGSLTFLNLDGLQGKTFGDGFKQLSSLTNVTLGGRDPRYCNLGQITNTVFASLQNIERLNISSCQIQDIDQSAFTVLTNLKYLDLSYNQDLGMVKLIDAMGNWISSSLSHLYINFIVTSPGFLLKADYALKLPRTLQVLEARGNYLENIDPCIFENLPQNLTALDLRENNFMYGSYMQKGYKMTKLEVLLLDGRSTASNFPSRSVTSDSCVAEKKANRRVSTDSRVTNLSCFEREFVVRTRQDENSSYLLTLPPKLKVISLVSSGLAYVLGNIAIDPNNELEELQLNNNNFPNLDGPLSGLKKLRQLSISNCHVRTVSPAFFNDLSSLTQLNLSHNIIGLSIWRERDIAIFRNLNNLRVLDVSYNLIEHISYHPNIFDGLDSIEELHLQTNRFWRFKFNISFMMNLTLMNLSDTSMFTFGKELRDQIDTLVRVRNRTIRIDMSRNPIVCICDNLGFIEWFVSSRVSGDTLSTENYLCSYPNPLELRSVTDGYAETLRELTTQCHPKILIFFITVMGTVVVTMVVVAMVVYRFRWKLRYLYYAAYLNFKGKVKAGVMKEFPYDAFVSYAFADENFVIQTLATELGSRDIKIHVHGRDFVAGDYIASNIVTAVKASRKTLVVLTRNLLKSTWCNYELQMANMESVHTGREVLIFLLKDSIPNKELGRDILSNIKNNTYIPYPNGEEVVDDDLLRAFWDKLASDIRN